MKLRSDEKLTLQFVIGFLIVQLIFFEIMDYRCTQEVNSKIHHAYDCKK